MSGRKCEDQWHSVTGVGGRAGSRGRKLLLEMAERCEEGGGDVKNSEEE